MIFLAVTLGFFAENIREHINGHSKEREYIHSLIEDLQSDTTLINTAIKLNSEYCRNDSGFLKSLNKAKVDSLAFKNVFQINPGKFNTQFYDSKTFDELKSTGDIRLIQNKKVLDAVSRYYQTIEKNKIFRDEIQTSLVYSYQHLYKVCDIYLLHSNYSSWQAAFKDRDELITSNEDLLKEYRSTLFAVILGMGMYDNNITLQKDAALQLIQLIKEEYSLKE
jgi:hypothetical protein